MRTKLERLCKKHGLRCISVSFFPELSPPFNVYTHKDYGECQYGSGSTFDAAFANALENYSGKD